MPSRTVEATAKACRRAGGDYVRDMSANIDSQEDETFPITQG